MLVKKLESIIRHCNGERIILVVLAHFHWSFKTSQQKRLEFFYFFIFLFLLFCLQSHTVRPLTIHHRIDSERRNRSDCSMGDRTLVDLYEFDIASFKLPNNRLYASSC